MRVQIIESIDSGDHATDQASRRLVQRIPDLDLVRQFASSTGDNAAVLEELTRRVWRDGGWLVPGVAIIVPDRLHGTGLEYVPLQPRASRGPSPQFSSVSSPRTHKERSHDRQHNHNR